MVDVIASGLIEFESGLEFGDDHVELLRVLGLDV